MRILLLFIFVCTLCSCSEEIVYIEDPLLSRVETYFDKVAHIKYPEGIRKINEEKNMPLIYPTSNWIGRTPTSYIIYTIDRFKKEIANQQDRFLVKDWWKPLDIIFINDYNANVSNTIVFETHSDHYNFSRNSYFQFTKGVSKMYYLPISEFKSSNKYSLNVEKVIWQNIEKTKGEIKDYNTNILWESKKDSLIIIENYNNYQKTELRFNSNNYSGKIKVETQDSLAIFTWNTLGHGNYIKKHSITKESNNLKIEW